MPRQVKNTDFVCPDDHKHEATQVCHTHHGCRCELCVSEARNRYQQRNGNGKWLAKELIQEIDHMVSLNQSIHGILWEMNINPITAKTTFYKNGRGDLARRMNREDLV